MRAWIKSACVVLAWSILSIILVAVGMKGSVHLVQANTRTPSSTEITLTSTLSVAAAPVTAASPTTKYVVRYGDTLSGIATRFAVRGGWRALYVANRKAIGPDPGVIHSGTVLVLPGQKSLVRYTVAAGDTLSGIAAEFGVRGGWRALYAANRNAIGPDPDVIYAGTVLTVSRPAAAAPPTSGQGRQQHPSEPLPPAGSLPHPQPMTRGAPVATGMPHWLTTMLLAVGLLILAAFLTGSVLAVRRRRQQPAARAAQLGRAGVGRRRDRGGRSRAAAAAVGPIAAAARAHPMGAAVPCVVLAAGIVLFTFVESAAVRVVPSPGGHGPGSVSAARPGTGQRHHRLGPRQPGQPALPGSRRRNARSLACSLVQIALPRPVLGAVPPAGPGRVPRASQTPSSRPPAGGLACEVARMPSSAAMAAAGSGGAGR
jgi:LysM repeat protein